MASSQAPTDVRISVLGRLRVDAGGREHDVDPSTQQGVLLSVLASRCNERIGVEELAEAVWPRGPSKTYRTGLRICVLKLRELIDQQRSRGTVVASAIVGHAEAYELRVPPEQIDAGRFEALVREGLRRLSVGHLGEAAPLLREALSTWGPPFAGIDNVVLQPHIERLGQTRRSAQRIDRSRRATRM
jgi:DNA-binding SARP family transcriptional activator